ncbi:hypothetical protein [Massilia niabensis]|uniref:Uncharacterized protein n=1 Tax=Massilia niabensis TaxID=544910 RepID=A0ABW0L920_9BURK
MPIPTELFATLMGRLATDNAAGSAAEAIRLWQTLFRKFSPLIGPLSAELLFVRSLRAHEAVFPWLPRVGPGATRTAFSEFERSLDSRTAEDIVAANHALLSTYITALADLIGMRLAVKFLGTAFADDTTNKKIEE